MISFSDLHLRKLYWYFPDFPREYQIIIYIILLFCIFNRIIACKCAVSAEIVESAGIPVI